jgi:hypothetical protein
MLVKEYLKINDLPKNQRPVIVENGAERKLYPG